jgi:hypothetical protein
MKDIKISIPTKDDIKPASVDARNALVEASKALPTLGVTTLIGGIHLAAHSVSEGAKGILALGSKARDIHDAKKLIKQARILEAAKELLKSQPES